MQGGKSQVCVKKKSKIAHSCFRAKAIDLKTIFVLTKTNFFFTVFGFFSTLPNTQTINVIDLFFSNELPLKNWAMITHFTLYLFFKAFF